MKTGIQKIRAYPNTFSIKNEFQMSLGVIALGLVMGYIAKLTDSVSIVGEIGTELGVWVFIAALIAAYSRYPFTAAINVMAFFLAMLCAYYLYGHIVLGFFPRSYFLGWLVASLLSSIAGFAVWFSKGNGILASITSALPVSVLFASGYPAFYTLRFTMLLPIGFGVILLFVLPKTPKQKIIALCFSLLFAFIIAKFQLISLLPF